MAERSDTHHIVASSSLTSVSRGKVMGFTGLIVRGLFAANTCATKAAPADDPEISVYPMKPLSELRTAQ
jgi:hypothetical protein